MLWVNRLFQFTMKPIFFKNQSEFRQWLEKNHDKEPELYWELSAQKNKSITAEC